MNAATTVAVAFVGVAMLSAGILSGGARLASLGVRSEAVVVEDFQMDEVLFEDEQDAAPRPSAAGSASVRTGRPVAPEVISPLASDGLTLERIEPRLPLSELALARPHRPGEPKPTLLHKPVATAAGRIEVQGHLIELPGLEIVEPGEDCETADGETWPCGMLARTAFRNWLRARAVECTVSDPPSPEPVESVCRLGKTDLGAWLVRSGWAKAADATYEAEQDEARGAGAGIWNEEVPRMMR
ncbi:MAG: thermonuclease family protein [Rhizobiaceae bacterium]|nr:thermonuclease family protein [Rhizobiaceae bacterium]MCV0405861.1 thermonuclease family protein [Rhizobiaceae bacterium]